MHPSKVTQLVIDEPGQDCGLVCVTAKPIKRTECRLA